MGAHLDSEKKKKGGKSNWMSHVRKTFEDGKKKKKENKYKDAMKDAKKTYKK